MEAVRRHPAATAFVLFAALSLGFFGLPVADHPGGELIATEDIEPSQYIWALEWWPHALLHGENPFHPDVVFAPDGYNIAWSAASVPAAALLLSPLTLLAGPVVSFNVLMLLCPAIAAWSAFLLCRHLTGAFAPSLAGGYLFGFSAPVVSNLQGVPNLAFVGLLPLLALLAIRHVDGSLGTRAYVAALAAVIALQFLMSSELLALALGVGAVALGAAALLMRERRAALSRTVRATLAAGALAALAVSPWLWWMLFEPHVDPIHARADRYSADLLSYVFPTGVQRLGRTWFAPLAETFGGEGGGFGAGGRAYLGLPLVAIVAAYVAERRHVAGARLLAAVLAVTALGALGPHLLVAGIRTMPLPWGAIDEVPYVEWAKPGHMATFTALGAAVAAALWLARRPSRRRWALAAAAILFLVPNLTSDRWHNTPPRPAFFADGRHEATLSEHDRVFIVPFVGSNLRWQAQEGIPWAVTGGYLGETPPAFARLYAQVGDALVHRDAARVATVRAALAAKGVTAVVVPDHLPAGWRALFDDVAGRPGTQRDGVTVWRLRSA